jgi:nucleoside-diphosphate-sugar epimerase
MRVLVTGISGFTGEHLFKALERQGDEPHALTADLRDRQAVDAQIAALRPEATIHLAALAFVASDDINGFYAINQVGSFHLLDARARHACSANKQRPSICPGSVWSA